MLFIPKQKKNENYENTLMLILPYNAILNVNMNLCMYEGRETNVYIHSLIALMVLFLKLFYFKIKFFL